MSSQIFCIIPEKNILYDFLELYATKKENVYIYNKYAYKKAEYNKYIDKIPLAPPRETLKLFGGYYTIEEFRKNLLKNDKIYKIVIPPMISLVPKIEENTINYEFINNSKHYIPLDDKLVDDAQESLRLKRSKPVTNIQNTLQSYMNLKVV